MILNLGSRLHGFPDMTRRAWNLPASPADPLLFGLYDALRGELGTDIYDELRGHAWRRAWPGTREYGQ